MKPEDFLYLDSEVIISVKYIDYGLNELKHLTGSPDSNHLAFYLLSNGFERLMKCIICFWEYKKNSTFPDVRKYGHNIKWLKQDIIKICYDMNYPNRCSACKEDVNYMEKDFLLNNTVDLLSKLGRKTRYYNFDKLMRVKIEYDDPNNVISKIEKEIIEQNEFLKKIQFDIKQERIFISGLNRDLMNVFRRFARALCRLFTLGDLGEEVARMYSHVSKFINILDSDLEQITE